MSKFVSLVKGGLEFVLVGDPASVPEAPQEFKIIPGQSFVQGRDFSIIKYNPDVTHPANRFKDNSGTENS